MICDASFVAGAVIGQSYATTMLQRSSFEVADVRSMNLDPTNPPDPDVFMLSIKSNSQPFAKFLRTATKAQVKRLCRDGVMGFNNKKTLSDLLPKNGATARNLNLLKELEVETLSQLHRFNELALELPDNMQELRSFRLPELGVGVEGTGIGPCCSATDFQLEISKNHATDFLWTMHVRSMDNTQNHFTGFFLHRDPISHDMILQSISSKKLHKSMRTWIAEVAKKVGRVDAHHSRVVTLTSDVLYTFWRQMVSNPETKFNPKAVTAVDCKQTLTTQDQVDVRRARQIKDSGHQAVVLSYFVKPTSRPLSAQELATPPQSFVQPKSHQVVVSRQLADLPSSDVCILSEVDMHDFIVVIDRARRRVFVIELVQQAATASKWITTAHARTLFEDDKAEPEVLVQNAPTYLRHSEVLMAIACFLSLLRVRFVMQETPFRVIPSLTSDFLLRLFDLTPTNEEAARLQVLGFCQSVMSGAYVYHKPIVLLNPYQTTEQYPMKASISGENRYSDAWMAIQAVQRLRTQAWKQPQRKLFSAVDLNAEVQKSLQTEFIFQKTKIPNQLEKIPPKFKDLKHELIKAGATTYDDNTREKTALTKTHVNPDPPETSLLFRMLEDCRKDECFVAAACIQPMVSGKDPNVYLHPLCAFTSTFSGDFGMDCHPFPIMQSDKKIRSRTAHSIPFKPFYQLVMSTKALKLKEPLCTSVKPAQLGLALRKTALPLEGHRNSKLFNTVRINLSTKSSSVLQRTFKIHPRLSAAWLISNLRNRLSVKHFDSLMNEASRCDEDSLKIVVEALRERQMSQNFVKHLEQSLHNLRALQKGILLSGVRESAKLTLPLNFENRKSSTGVQILTCVEMLHNTWRQFLFIRDDGADAYLYRDVRRYDLLFENPANFVTSSSDKPTIRAMMFPKFQIRVRSLQDSTDGFNAPLVTALGERLSNAGSEPFGVFQTEPAKAGSVPAEIEDAQVLFTASAETGSTHQIFFDGTHREFAETNGSATRRHWLSERFSASEPLCSMFARASLVVRNAPANLRGIYEATAGDSSIFVHISNPSKKIMLQNDRYELKVNEQTLATSRRVAPKMFDTFEMTLKGNDRVEVYVAYSRCYSQIESTVSPQVESDLLNRILNMPLWLGRSKMKFGQSAGTTPSNWCIVQRPRVKMFERQQLQGKIEQEKVLMEFEKSTPLKTSCRTGVTRWQDYSQACAGQIVGALCPRLLPVESMRDLVQGAVRFLQKYNFLPELKVCTQKLSEQQSFLHSSYLRKVLQKIQATESGQVSEKLLEQKTLDFDAFCCAVMSHNKFVIRYHQPIVYCQNPPKTPWSKTYLVDMGMTYKDFSVFPFHATLVGKAKKTDTVHADSINGSELFKFSSWKNWQDLSESKRRSHVTFLQKACPHLITDLTDQQMMTTPNDQQHIVFWPPPGNLFEVSFPQFSTKPFSKFMRKIGFEDCQSVTFDAASNVLIRQPQAAKRLCALCMMNEFCDRASAAHIVNGTVRLDTDQNFDFWFELSTQWNALDSDRRTALEDIGFTQSSIPFGNLSSSMLARLETNSESPLYGKLRWATKREMSETELALLMRSGTARFWPPPRRDGPQDVGVNHHPDCPNANSSGVSKERREQLQKLTRKVQFDV